MADETKINNPDEAGQPSPETPSIPDPETPIPETVHEGEDRSQSPDSGVVVSFDRVVQKNAAAQEGAEEKPAPDSDRDAALRKEQEALLAALDQRAADFDKGKSRSAKNAAKSKPALTNDKQKRPARPPKPGKADKPGADKTTPAKQPRKPSKPDAPVKEESPAAPVVPETPPPPRESPRPDTPEQIVHIKLDELHAFKNHPFAVRDDEEMRALMESVREKGVNQPIIARPRESGGYEIIAGHRRQFASRLAGFNDIPCIVRNLTDDEAILAMTDDNLRQRSEILPSEKALSLKMQVEAISHQGARTSGQIGQKEAGQRSVDIVAARNGTSAKQVQRYMRLTDLVPDLLKAVDEKKIGFTTAVEVSFIRPRNQNYIAVAMEAEQSAPSFSQAQRLHELDKDNKLNGDVIDGILGEQKKEEIRVIITGKELESYFGKKKTPQEMKEQIIKLLDEWAGKEKEKPDPEKNPER